MSRDICRDILNLRPTPRFGHTEFSVELHHAYIKRPGGFQRLYRLRAPGMSITKFLIWSRTAR